MRRAEKSRELNAKLVTCPIKSINDTQGTYNEVCINNKSKVNLDEYQALLGYFFSTGLCREMLPVCP